MDMKYNLEKLFFLVDDNNPFSNLLKFARLFKILGHAIALGFGP